MLCLRRRKNVVGAVKLPRHGDITLESPREGSDKTVSSLRSVVRLPRDDEHTFGERQVVIA